MKNNLIIASLSILLLMFSAYAGQVSLFSGGNGYGITNVIEVNQTVTFFNNTATNNFGPPNSKIYIFTGPGLNSIYNTTGTIKFSIAGNWTGYLTMYNSTNDTVSSNAFVIVRPDLKVNILPSTPQAVYGEALPLTASVSGGVGPYGYQWYNDSSCTTKVNDTTPYYTTNVLNSTTSLSYCVIANDVYGYTSKASANIAIFQNLYTSQGEVVSLGNHSAVISPTILISDSGSYIVSNVTPYALFNVSLCEGNYNVYDTGLTPTFVNLSIDGSSYNLFLNQSLPFGGGGCYVKLLNVSWTQILDSSTLEFYSTQPLPSTTVTSTSSSSTTSTVTTTIAATVVSKATPVSSISTKLVSSSSNIVTSANSPTVKKAVSSLPWFFIGLGIFALVIIVLAINMLKSGGIRRKPPQSSAEVTL